jgi:DNA modification methylase
METKNENVKLMLGNNIDKLKELPDNFVDSIVTDPPYGISFMNKKWDYDVPSVEFWKEVYRVLKPGGHILSFGGTRTYHRMVVNIEDAGFEIRDQIMWVYGSGFPKSLNIGKEVDKKLGNEREVIGIEKGAGSNKFTDGINGLKPEYENTKGNSQYEGWGTGLKPANEPIVLARKPIEEKTITENVLRWGTGGINIDGCRVSHNEPIRTMKAQEGGNKVYQQAGRREETTELKEEGRFPANFIIDEEASKILDEQSGETKSIKSKRGGAVDSNSKTYNWNNGDEKIIDKYECGFTDKGGASRFFYVPKVGKKERNLGLDNFEDKEKDRGNALKCGTCGLWILRASGESCKCGDDRVEVKGTTKNNHPTVKPINLLTYLCRLITPKGGVILDPYMGSGSTGILRY